MRKAMRVLVGLVFGIAAMTAAAQQAPLVHAYAQTLQSLFLYTLPVAALALLLALILLNIIVGYFTRK